MFMETEKKEFNVRENLFSFRREALETFGYTLDSYEYRSGKFLDEFSYALHGDYIHAAFYRDKGIPEHENLSLLEKEFDKELKRFEEDNLIILHESRLWKILLPFLILLLASSIIFSIAAYRNNDLVYNLIIAIVSIALFSVALIFFLGSLFKRKRNKQQILNAKKDREEVKLKLNALLKKASKLRLK